jgi:hypothetical protein
MRWSPRFSSFTPTEEWGRCNRDIDPERFLAAASPGLGEEDCVDHFGYVI